MGRMGFLCSQQGKFFFIKLRTIVFSLARIKSHQFMINGKRNALQFEIFRTKKLLYCQLKARQTLVDRQLYSIIQSPYRKPSKEFISPQNQPIPCLININIITNMSLKQLKSLFTTMMVNIDSDLSQIPFFATLHKTYSLKPSHICLTLITLVCTLAIFDIAGDLLTSLFGMLYPAYMSFKAIEKQNEEQKNVWLTYWIVFGLLTSIDDVFGSILDIIPGFYALRLVVYVWMFYPRANNGSVRIYGWIKPYLQKWKNLLEAKKE